MRIDEFITEEIGQRSGIAMTFQTIIDEVRSDGMGIITLNRPEKRNAISIQMRRELSSCLKEWEASEDVHLVIFNGAGSTFSAGFDLREFQHPELFDDLFTTSAKYHRDVWNFPKPTIAAINGPALAGGFDLAALCDLRICSETAYFSHPEIKFGAPPLVTPLRWIIGDGLARDICLTGRTVDATEAYRIGLVSEVVEGDGLLDRAVQIALIILKAPLKTLRRTKIVYQRV